MSGLSLPEILFLAVLALIVIGPKQLPEVARTIGRFINELRRSTSVFSEELKSQVRIEPFDLMKPPPAKKPASPSTEPSAQEPVQQELTVQQPETTAVTNPKDQHES
jgi:sec-independent protein translocase protein TatB